LPEFISSDPDDSPTPRPARFVRPPPPALARDCALFLDIACKMQITAESAGGATLLSPEKDWRRKQGSLIKRDHMEAAFAHLVRKLHNK